jgi:hypothetical protein
LRGFCKSLPGGAGFASLQNLHGGRRSRAGFPPILTWNPRVGGWMPWPALSCSVVVGGAWLIRDPWPWKLVKILAAFVLVHGFLPEACGFLPGSLGPAWVGAMDDVRTPLIESL